MDPLQNEQRYLKSKYKVKKWESEFKKIHGINPSKVDIKSAPHGIKAAYRTYWTLKTLALENELFDVTLDDDTNTFPTEFAAVLNCISDNAEANVSILEGSVLHDDSCSDAFYFSGQNKLPNFDDATSHDTNLAEQLSQISSVTISIADTSSTPALDSSVMSDSSVSKNSKKESNTKEGYESSVPVEKVDDQNASSVWGKHLNKKKIIKDKESSNQSELNFMYNNYAKKLFPGAKFKLRNPRKPFVRQKKNTVGIVPIAKTDTYDSENEFLSDTANSTIGNNESFKDNETSLLDISLALSQTFDMKCTKEEIDVFNRNQNISISACQSTSQPVSVLQKTLSETDSSNVLPLRKVNTGWLERITLSSQMESKPLAESTQNGAGIGLSVLPILNNCGDRNLSLEPSDNSTSVVSSREEHLGSQESNSDSEGDFVYDSDTERRNKTVNRLSSSNCAPKRPLSHIVPVPSTRPVKKIRLDCLVLTPKSNNLIESYSALVNKKIEFTEKSNTDVVVKNNKNVPDNKLSKSELLEKKVTSGKANENFVRINLKKKVYVRGKKTMTFSKYKKQQWKANKRAQGFEGFGGRSVGVLKCFNCGDVGHYSKQCMKAKDQLIPKEEIGDEEDESPFPSLEEAAEMAKEIMEKVHTKRNMAQVQQFGVLPEESAEEIKLPVQPEEDSNCTPDSIVQPLLKLNSDGSLIETPLIVFKALMELGYEQFRPGQEEAIMRILSGLSTLVTIATGTGKSLCYQLPAYLYAQRSHCITLVISPLISLMEDQIVGSSSCVRAACLHTNQTPKHRELVLDELKKGTITVLLVSPEAIVAGDRQGGGFLKLLPPVAFACIDEAHCVSQWSHNFRPCYLMVCQVLRKRLGVKTLLGLTATATQATVVSIISHLETPDGIEGVIRDTPLPDNLLLSVSKDLRRDLALLQLLTGERFAGCNSIIVYCTRRDECQRLAAFIRTSLQDPSKETGKRTRFSWNAEAYHAGLTAARRRQVQNMFMSGNVRIVVATVAFGMGINKQDIRGVIHYNMPSTFEHYVQEVGRAGRDGLPAHCHVFLDSEGRDLNELRRHVYADTTDRHVIRKLLQRVFLPCRCPGLCPGHEVGLPIETLVGSLDLPQENISTLLCYLELHPKCWVQSMPPAYLTCKVTSYKGAKVLRQSALKCPPLAMAIAMELAKGGTLEKMSKLEFNVFTVATAINWDSGVVKRELKNLEWKRERSDKFVRSQLVVELSELGLRVRAPGNLSSEQLDAALDSLHDHVRAQERRNLAQLQMVFDSLTEISHRSVEECKVSVDLERCEKLKAVIREYFTRENPGELPPLPKVELKYEEQVVSDIHSLVSSYRDCNFTGRSVARIFHGIPSPNFPAIVWARNRFWRAHLNQDFSQLCKVSTRELLRMR